MTKLLLALAIALNVSTVFAEANLPEKEALEMDVLVALIENAKDIELVTYGGDDGETYVKFDYTLAQLIAGALKQNYLSGNSTLSYTNVHCKEVTNSLTPGSRNYGCNVMIGSGDFEQSEGQFTGPLIESTYMISIDVVVPTVINSKPVITTKVAVVGIAG